MRYLFIWLFACSTLRTGRLLDLNWTVRMRIQKQALSMTMPGILAL